jgi:phospholipid/cholesterol/gamma-HCH transport system permease protein
MATDADIVVENADPGQPLISFSGDWLITSSRPDVALLLEKLPEDSCSIRFSSANLGQWDSTLLTATSAIYTHAKAQQIDVDFSGLPNGAQRLLKLAFAVAEREGARRHVTQTSFVERAGKASIEAGQELLQIIEFIGELTLSFNRLIKGKANYLKSDLIVVIQEAGAEALPIVGLISFLIGMIFAFVGVIQLNPFGAGIYTADLVAVAMVREMAPIMTAIIIAGSTGAAYAAQIGTMKVNEEIDALTTLGINPVDFLALPRVIALVLMMPLLTMYSSLLGILGGLAVGISMLDVSAIQYAVQTKNALNLSTLFGGLFKSIVYGSLVALAGCLQGLNCGNNAMAVGQATTKAVVMGIVMIVVSAAILTIIYINLDI